jgi:ABC-type transport system involved in Fe-S cluster assembly fused permease/ATPase subunit
MAYTNLTVTKGNQSKVVRVPVAGLNPLSMMLTVLLVATAGISFLLAGAALILTASTLIGPEWTANLAVVGFILLTLAYLNSRVNARRTRKLLAYTAAIGAQM